MAPAQSFTDLIVWQRAHQFVLDVYAMTKNFPREELFGLSSQLRRAAVSVPANIAEGFRRRGRVDKLRFYNTSQTSLEECRYYLILAHDLQYSKTEKMSAQLDEIARMLDSYMRKCVPGGRLLRSLALLFF